MANAGANQPAGGAAQPRSRILVGIDYGTTYTGLAYTTETPETTTTLSDVLSFRWWPVKQQAKVPSALSYSATREGKGQWGADIDNNSEVLQWTKLELQPKDTLKELKVLKKLMQGLQLVRNLHEGKTDTAPHQISKSSEDIVRDYLLKVTRHWHASMTNAHGGDMKAGGRNTFRVIPVDLVITHPVDWEYEALNKTYRAIMGAMPKGMFPKLRDVYMISEPEACALYTVRDMIDRDRNTLVEGECFVLCDAGGGTVDLASYRIDSIEPLSLERIGQLSGDQCGATFIDREFLTWCSTKMEDMPTFENDRGAGDHFILDSKARTLLNRFEIHKHGFEGTRDADIEIPDETKVTDPVVANSGTLTLTTKDLRSFFAKSVDGTVKLIRRQIAQIHGREIGGHYCQVTNIFLAGGLSENPYVRERVKQCAREHGGIEVREAHDGWSGVVRGAVLAGIGMGIPIPPKVSRCLRHYGVCVAEEYKHWQHFEQDQVSDVFHGRPMARDPLIWKVRKGDLILPNEPIIKVFAINCKFTDPAHQPVDQTVNIKFVATALDDLPLKLSQLPRDSSQVVDIGIPLRAFDVNSLTSYQQANAGNIYYQADVTVTLKVFTKVTLDVTHRGRSIKSFSTTL